MSALRILLVLSVVLAVTFGSAIVSPKDNVAMQVVSDVVTLEAGDASTFDESKAVTPYGYKATMMQAGGRKIPCWRCSSPCSAYMCCDDYYPQCCYVTGLGCRCCRY